MISKLQNVQYLLLEFYSLIIFTRVFHATNCIQFCFAGRIDPSYLIMHKDRSSEYGTGHSKSEHF